MMIKNKFYSLIISFVLLLNPTAGNASIWDDAWDATGGKVIDAGKKAVDWTKKTYKSAEEGLESAVKHGIHEISKLPDKLKKLVTDKLDKLKNKVVDKIVDKLQVKDVKFRKNIHKVKKIGSNRLSNIYLDVNNKAKIVSIGALTASFRVGLSDISWAHLDVSLGLGKSGSNWINSVSIPSKADYDIHLESDISGKIILLGGENYIGSIVEGSYYKK